MFESGCERHEVARDTTASLCAGEADWSDVGKNQSATAGAAAAPNDSLAVSALTWTRR